MSYAQAQSQTPSSQQNQHRASDGGNRATAPPLNITVLSPQPSAEDAKKEEAYRQREVAAQEDVRDFTRMLTWVSIAQATITLFALGAAVRAANAAKRTAEVASDALVLTEGADLQVEQLDSGNRLADDTRLVLRFRNFGRTTASNSHLEWEQWSGTPIADVTPTPGHVAVPPNNSVSVKASCTIGTLTGDKAAEIEAGNLSFGLKGAIYFEDRFGFIWKRQFQANYLPGTGFVRGIESETRTKRH